MSYDLFLYSRKCPEIVDNSVEINTSLLSIDEPYAVEPEDIPSHILLKYEGIAYMTCFYLQPYTTDENAIKKAMRIATEYAEKYDGVIDNPQSGKMNAKIDKVKLPRVTKESEYITVSFYFHTDKSMNKVLPLFVELIEQYLPAALPRRYGDYEPPKYKYAEQGKEHFLSFISTCDFPVWYASKPVSYVFISDPEKTKYVQDKYHCNRISIEVLKEAYNKENWKAAIHTLLKKASVTLEVFYAQIIDSEDIGVVSWWWKGLPPNTGYAYVIGEPYYSLLKLEKGNGVNIDESMMYFNADSKIKIHQKYISRKKLFVPQNVMSHENFKDAKIMPFKH